MVGKSAEFMIKLQQKYAVSVKKAKYCSEDCQFKDWKNFHKQECQILRKNVPCYQSAQHLMCSSPSKCF